MNHNRRRIALLKTRVGTPQERPGDRGELAQRKGDLARAALSVRPASTGTFQITQEMKKYKRGRPPIEKSSETTS